MRRLAIAVFMAERALNLALSRMDAMAVGDWLHRRPWRAEGTPIKQAPGDHDYNAQGNEESAASHSAQIYSLIKRFISLSDVAGQASPPAQLRS